MRTRHISFAQMRQHRLFVYLRLYSFVARVSTLGRSDFLLLQMRLNVPSQLYRRRMYQYFHTVLKTFLGIYNICLFELS